MASLSLRKKVVLADSSITYSHFEKGDTYRSIDLIAEKLLWRFNGIKNFSFLEPLSLTENEYLIADEGFGFDIDLDYAKDLLQTQLQSSSRQNLNIEIKPNLYVL